MKKIKIITETREVEVLEDVICNKCGNSCRPGKSVPDYYGLVEACFTTGYESTHFDDGLVFNFSLCEKCLFELFKTFKIQPNKEGYF